MKKVLFFVFTIIVAGGAWYVSENTGPAVVTESKLDKVLQRMEKISAMRSSILGNITEPYTLAEITDYEDVYQNEADTRIARGETVRTNERNAINALIPSVSTTTQDALFLKAKSQEYATAVPEFLTSNSELSPLSTAIKEEIIKKTKLIGFFSKEIRSINIFKEIWAADRLLVCTTDDTINDIYKRGTMTLTYATTDRTAVDSCETISGVQKVKQSICADNMYTASTVSGSENPRLTTCPFGCSEGACKKGQMGAIALLDGPSGSVVTSRQKDQEFYIKLSPIKDAAASNVKVDITSASFTGNKCTLATKSINVATSGSPITFGPIRCSEVATHTFALNLKVGTTTTETQSVSMAYDGINIDHFDVAIASPQADKIGSLTPVNITVRAIGSTGLPYTGYTGVFDVLIVGDAEADYDRKAYTLNTNGTLTIPGIKFPTAGTYKILIASVSGTKTITGEKEVIVKSAPTATLTAFIGDNTTGVEDNITVASGNIIKISWVGGSFASATSTVTANPASCNKTWISFTPSSQSGSETFTVPNHGSGVHINNCIWTVKYAVKNSLGDIAEDTLVITGPTS